MFMKPITNENSISADFETAYFGSRTDLRLYMQEHVPSKTELVLAMRLGGCLARELYNKIPPNVLYKARYETATLTPIELELACFWLRQTLELDPEIDETALFSKLVKATKGRTFERVLLTGDEKQVEQATKHWMAELKKLA